MQSTRIYLGIVAITLTVACVPISNPSITHLPEPVAAMPGDMLTYEVTSWGRTTFHVEMMPDGHVSSQRIDFNSGAVSATRDEIRNPADYTAIMTQLLRFEQPVATDCRTAMTDGPTGKYHWRRGGQDHEFSFYYGCRSQTVWEVETIIMPILSPQS